MDIVTKYMDFHIYFQVLMYILMFCNSETKGSVSQGTLNEYCLTDEFHPSCESDEVVIVYQAAYGRMKIGTCVDGNYGYLGCTSNQLKYLDSKCSGKQTCIINIAAEDAIMSGTLNCTIPKSFTRYLEARYTCEKVFQPNKQKCTEPEHIPLKSSKLTIASTTTHQTGCGLEAKPWVIEAKPGQKVNVSLTDFKWNSQVPGLVKCPVRYGYIIDVGINQLVDICGGTDRQKHVYVSEGHSLQVIVDRNGNDERRFLMSFQVIGCPKFVSPKNTWTRVDGLVITVGCVDGDRVWKMRCIGNHWIGIVGNCDRALQSTHQTNDIQEKSNTILGMSPVVAYSLIGGMFLIALCIVCTVVIGCFCIRKPKTSSKECYLTPVTYPYNSTLPLHVYPASTSGRVGLQHNGQDTSLLLNRTNSHGNTVGRRADNNDIMHEPQYFVLENTDDRNGSNFDAVYQNINDVS